MRSGDVIADQFELVRAAGSGGMGEVWLARDRVHESLVALKVLTRMSETGRAAFTREALVLADLRHPGIVRYVAHGITSSQEPYLVMEWLEGDDLSRRLARGRLGIEETTTLLGRVADALGAAHARGIVHRDIKPSNLFLPDGAIARVKILDFGVAKPGAAMQTRTRAGAPLGTPGYMAPEQARGDADIDARADVFALGCVAFECLTGRRAFEGEHAMAVFAKILLEDVPRIAPLRSGIPARLEALVQRMLSKDREQRPGDALVLAGALAECDGGSAERAASLPPGLTRSEQRMTGVVFIPASGAEPGEGPAPDDPGAIADVVAERGARLERLADGSLVAILARRGGASDLAAQAAQCALRMRSVLPDRPMALSVGRSEVEAQLAGEVIDRAAGLLLDDAGIPREVTAGILLDGVTAGLLDARFQVVGVGGRLELRAEIQHEAARTLLGKATECVGRERELAALEAIFAECAAESVARAVLVTATAGVGKSRLRSELVARLRRRAEQAGSRIEIWTGRADPMRGGSAFGMIAEMLRQTCGISDGDPIEARQEGLKARVARHVRGDLQRVTEFLGELIGAPFPDHESPQLRAARQDPMLLGDQMRRAWEDFVKAESEASPLLVVLEDLHWGDLPTVKLVDSVLRNLRQHPIMVLALARPDVHDRFPNLWAEREAQEVRLSALTRKASVRLVRSALDASVSDETVLRIVERAEGNAFYLEELVRAVAEGSAAAFPETIVAMVQARLERLDAGARQMLRAASVFGQTFWKEGTSELLGGAPEIGEWLAHLADEEIVSRQPAPRFAGDEEYGFRHALLREGAYAMLTEEDRALGHRLAGDWLDRKGERDAMVLAEHFERGGSRERALGFYPRAAEQALEGNDLEGVLARVERGVACGAIGAALGALRGIQAEAHNWRGENVEGERRAAEAMALLEPGAAPWYAAAREGIITAGKLGLTERVVEVIGRVRALAADRGTRDARRMALGWGAMNLVFAGLYPDAEALLDDLRRSGDELRAADPRVEAVLTKARALWAYLQKRFEALELFETALAGFEQAGDVRNASSARADVGVWLLEFGAYEDAEPLFRTSLAEVERMSIYTSIPQVKANLGCVLIGLGKLDEARTMLDEAAVMFNAQGDSFLEGIARAYLATTFLNMGRFAEAETTARAALLLLQETPGRALALAALAQALLGQESLAPALAAAEEAMALLRSLGVLEIGEPLVRLAFAETLWKLGDPRAPSAIAEARDVTLARAGDIADLERRRSFLERVPENSRILALAGANAET